MKTQKFTFGIYPLSAAGTPFGVATGPQDDYEKIGVALNNLGGKSKKLIPRNYLIYIPEWESKMFSLADQYLKAGLIGDLVLGCGDWTRIEESSLQIEHWLNFIRKVIDRYGSHLSSLQITNEPNLSFMEGSKPYILEALVNGVMVAKKEIIARNLLIPVGFGSVPDGPIAVPHFWGQLAKEGSRFLDAIDFIGHNFYIDVFEDASLGLKEISVAVDRALRGLREHLYATGIQESVPIRVTENGWPTGKNPISHVERSYERQQEVLNTIIKTIYDLRAELNISHYALFGLRDADSSKEDLFHQYGIMRDDYSPKPAYSAFRTMIQDLGSE